MAKKSFLTVPEAKPATKVFSVRIEATLHDRATDAVKLASSLGYQLDLAHIISDCLNQAVTSAENELIHFLMQEPPVPEQTPESLEDIEPRTIDPIASETAVDFCDENYEF
jgi:hypothetical protein